MKLVVQNPPNIEQIRTAFPLIEQPVLYAYGDVIYNPDNALLDKFMIAHEEVHSEQQKEMGVAEWWTKYCADASFRLSQEIPAYQKQYQMFAARKPGYMALDNYAKALAGSISGSVYGNMISFDEALNVITHG